MPTQGTAMAGTEEPPRRGPLSPGSYAIGLLIVLTGAKLASIAGRPIASSVWNVAALIWQDVAAALVFYLLAATCLSRLKATCFVYAAVVIYVAVNVPITRLLSSPLTVSMFRAARGALRDSVTHHFSVTNILLIVGVAAAGFVILWLPRKISRGAGIALVLGGIAVSAIGAVSASRANVQGWHRNALFALAESALPRVTASRAVEEWRRSPFSQEPMPASDLLLKGAGAGRNVILIMLESTGASYLRPYGAAEDPTPNLTALATDSVVFENAYAVYPESIKGLFSVLCSRYPAFDTTAEMYARIATPSIASVLHGQGYRTAMFHSGRFMYLGMRSIIDNRGFEVLEDAGDIGGNHQSSFGVDEPATVERILSWIDSLERGQPFFLTYLPIAGHHPYSTPAAGPFPEDTEIDRYRNALHFGDAALGQLLAGLRQRGIEDRTLFVLAGDHGEAFGQHEGNFGHTLFIYEENIRVPLLISLPGVTRSETRVSRVASLIDLAPTILDLLAIPPPPGYQGSSLLEPDEQMALFYTDYSLALAGLRDGHWKAVLHLRSDRVSLFDLALDPAEQNNIAPRFPDRAAAYRDRLKHWSAAQKDLIIRADEVGRAR